MTTSDLSTRQVSSYLEQSLSLAREIGDKSRIAFVLPPLGMAAVGLGDLTRARAYSEEAVVLARELGRPRDLAVALISLAQLHRLEGQLAVAEPLYEEALSLFRELGDQEATAIGLLNLAMVSIGQGRGGQAQSLLVDALSIAKQVGSRHLGQSAIEVAASLCVLHEAWRDAARFFGAAEAQAERAGLRRDAADEAFLAPLMAKARSALTTMVYNVVTNEGKQLPYDDALKSVRIWLENLLEPQSN